MLTIAGIALLCGYFILVWLRTDAFVEYINLLRLSRFFHIYEYNALHAEGYAGNYTSFLFEYYHDNFFVRLVCCPVCLSFWLGLFVCLGLGSCAAAISSPLMLFFYLVFNKML
jgi:hypothetical protein